MRLYSDAALAAFSAGRFLSVGAVEVLTSPTPIRVWGGYGQVEIAGNVFDGIGDAGLVSVTGKAVGATEQAMQLTLSGVESANLALLSQGQLRGVETRVWRLIYDSAGVTLLDTQQFGAGRIDGAVTNKDAATSGRSSYTIGVTIEGAARGLGRAGGRLRSDADQRLSQPTSGIYRKVTYAGTKTVYWGGVIPSSLTGSV